MPDLKTTIGNFLRKFIREPDPKKTTAHIPDTTGDLSRFMSRMTKSYFDSMRPNMKRTSRYDEYEYLDKNLSEATATLNIYADNIVSGAIGGIENYQVVVAKNTPNITRIEEVVKDTERRTRVKDDVWDVARDMICFGDDWEEVVIGELNGKYGIIKLKKLPPKEMYADVDERGVWNNSQYPYVQKKLIIDKEGIPFEWWRAIHFKVGRGVYGVDRSIFANASRRIGRQLLWIDESMVLARLSRAYMRYAFLVDTSGLSLEDKFRFAEEFLERVRRKEIVDRSSGRISPLDSPWMPDEDIAIPVEKDSPQDIRTLAGDVNVGKIEDVKYFQEKFFMALNMPKAYASKEQEVRAKATITQLDVQFARQVRRKQAALRPGLRKFYKTAFYLDGIDPDSFEWEVVFPPLATLDEMLKWEMEELKAKIAKTYTVDANVLNNLWIMEVLLGFDEEQIERYSIIPPAELRQPTTTIPPEVASMIRKDPTLRWALEDLKDLAMWKVQRDKEMEDKKPVGIEREEELRDRWKE